ncbi:hypothetical protein LRP88_14064 [Fusarium phalaenopsidis]
MGSRLAHAYLSSPEVVAASALSGRLSGTGVYKAPENFNGVRFGYGTGLPASPLSQLDSAVEQLESFIDRVQASVPKDDGITDNIYAGKYTYQDDITKEGMAKVCMENYDPEFRSIAKPNDILIPLVVASTFSSIFARNSINNALLGLEVPRLVERLRATLPASERIRTRRTGWTLTWDVARSVAEVQKGEGGELWEEKVGQFPENLQEIIAKGGLTDWTKHEIAKAEA